MDAKLLYVKGTRVWVPDPESVWVGATLLEDIKDDQLELGLEDGREIILDLKVSNFQMPPLRNPDILLGANDLTTLSYLHEPAVLHNLRERFVNTQYIYTYCGIVLVALNPYHNVPIYGNDMISAYSGQTRGEMDPHIFAIAEDAFHNMVNHGKNQSIIVSGESGAGKTVSAKYTMRYFANVGGAATETNIEQKVLASNPIMEAIGNAKTIRNDNSSRFGKYIELNFNETYHIIGAHMKTYLLEKSRVVYQASNERNYHIFYQLCASRELPELQELCLKPSEEFFYTQQGENPVIAGVNDQTCFQETCDAMALLGIYSEQQRMIWRILSAVLHLGNIDIHRISKVKDDCSVKNDDFHLLMVAGLLGIDGSQLCKWLCARKIVATGDVYVKPLTWREANNGRDALAKHIYSQLFKWIVEHINANLAIVSERKSFIGVLDIYGFETFEVNSFEQFCINYANEKLQQQFNQHVFKLEQEEYVREQINWSFIDFYDNQPCIDLIETKLGILDLLDEECRMPKGSDQSWATKLYKQHLGKAQHFVKPRMSDEAFIIRHYADDVIYDCKGFVEKNRDLVNDEHLALLRASQYELVGELFQTEDPSNLYAPRKRTSSRVGRNAPKGKKTVGSEFRDSLKKLMEALNTTSPNYVRCIKSNDEKQAFTLDLHRCVQQLRACGVLETVRISAAGYPSRWTYEEFFERYRMLIAWECINWESLHGTCGVILSNHMPDEDKFQLGKTKIFFRAGSVCFLLSKSQNVDVKVQVAYLERLRSDKLRLSCVLIQKNIRCWVACRKYRRLRCSTIKLQSWIRGYQARRLAQFLRETRAATRVQTIWRGYILRRAYLRIRNDIIMVQSYIRGCLARRKLKRFIQELRAVVVQKVWRGYIVRKEYSNTRKAIIFMQCCVRRKAAKKEFKRLKIEARSVEHLKSLTKGMEKKVMTLTEKLTAQTKAKQELQVKLSKYSNIEEENLKLRDIVPKWEQLEKETLVMRTDNETLAHEIERITQDKENISRDSERIVLDKDKEIETLKELLEQARNELDTEKERNETERLKQQELLETELKTQHERLSAEFDNERSSHQKMVGEYARLEQRFANLQEELKIEKMSPEKTRRSSSIHEMSQSTEDISATERLENLTAELIETRCERDMLLEQVELQREEHDISLSIPHSPTAASPTTDEEVFGGKGDKKNNTATDKSQQQTVILTIENEKLKKELGILKQAIEEDENDSSTDNKEERLITPLLKQIEELRNENTTLRNDANKKIVQEEVISPRNINVVAEKEISRLTMENLELRSQLDKVKAQLKEVLSRTISSPPSQKNLFANQNHKGLSPRSKSNVSELMRNRSQTIDNRISEGNISEAGKLFMTYAGLMRKKPGDNKSVSSNGDSPSRRRLGMLKFTQENQGTVVEKFVTTMEPQYVAKEIAGLPAHMVFMAIRYVDYMNEERLMQSFLTSVISMIKKRVTKVPGDIDMQAFWLSNTFTLFSDMKQFSGETQFQSVNSREQNDFCLNNFDLSEYRQVLSDTCVKIYQDMAANIQSRINNLIVPGMLEYESIPGVVSTLQRFKSRSSDSDEIITVKDITNKLSAILAVLNAHCVHPSLIKQIFRQIYCFINATMVNNILLRKDMCHWSRGLQIKFNLTQLEEWCRTNQLHENINVVEQLEPVTEVVQLLQVNKKSLDDVDTIIALTSKLNSLQVQKILSMYTPPNEYEPRVPSNLIRAVVNRMKPNESKVKQLMCDLKYIVPMNVPFVSSNVLFNTILIPKELDMENFEIL